MQKLDRLLPTLLGGMAMFMLLAFTGGVALSQAAEPTPPVPTVKEEKAKPAMKEQKAKPGEAGKVQGRSLPQESMQSGTTYSRRKTADPCEGGEVSRRR